jgi:hypothetical protein
VCPFTFPLDRILLYILLLFILVRWGRNLLFRLSWRPLPLDLEDSILRVFHLHLGVVVKPNEVSDRFASIACRVVNVPLQHIGKDLLFSGHTILEGLFPHVVHSHRLHFGGAVLELYEMYNSIANPVSCYRC